MARNLGNIVSSIGVPALIIVSLSLLTLLEVEGLLTPKRFAVSCVIVMISAGIIWSVCLTKRLNGTSPETSSIDAGQVNNKKKQIQIAMVLIFLVLATWMTRGGPWLPRLVGAFMLLLFMTGIVLRKTD